MLLSFVVLYVWSALTPHPTNKKNTIEISQNIENKEVVTFQPPSTPPVVDKPLAEEIQIIESDLLVAHFSNIGGNLKEVIVKKFNQSLPLTNFFSLENYDKLPFKLTELKVNAVTYEATLKDIKVIKNYTLVPNDYLIHSSITILNESEMSKQEKFRLDNFVVDAASEKVSNSRSAMLFEYSVYDNGIVERKHNAVRFAVKDDKVLTGDVQWLGFRDQYFCAVAKPEYKMKEYFIHSLSDKKLEMGGITDTIQLAPQETVLFNSLLYVGPQDKSILKSYKTDFEKIITYSLGGYFNVMSFGLIDPIANILLTIMQFFHKIIPNWGITIILIAFFLYAVTYPITRRTMANMKDTQTRMQIIQPEITKLREKYSNNPTKLNQALMELYKKHHFNPLSSLGGCLPLFLQMPIFISLYQLLWRTYYFKGAHFLWIKDLSQPDRLFVLPFNFPIIGNEINILPLYYAAIMAFQQKLQTKTMVAADPSQAEAQKMMAKIFPVMFAVLFYRFASGLTMYFCIYFTLSALTQWAVSKDTKKGE